MRTEAQKRAHDKYMRSAKGKAKSKERLQRPEIIKKTREYNRSPDRLKYKDKYNKSLEGRLTTRARVNTQYKNNPIFRKKALARGSARWYIPAIECLLCGSKERLERHHPDYDKPLEVIILCRDCHMEVERRSKL
jgi:hypothetical protein